TINMHQSDTIKVWLIVFNSQTNILAAIDSQVVTSGGGIGAVAYSFQSVVAGSYRVKAAMLSGPSSGTGLLPTYNSNPVTLSPILWSNATVITHTSNAPSAAGIRLAVGTITSGPGFIGGNVSQGANKGTANGIAKMAVLLLDANNNPVKYAVT